MTSVQILHYMMPILHLRSTVHHPRPHGITGAARLPVVLYGASILKSSPEGEGFSPNPRGGQ